MKNEDILKELIQDAVSEYVFQTGETDFIAVIEVKADAGWTQTPEIKDYKQYGSNDDKETELTPKP